MIADANPLESPPDADFSQRQTVEFRCPDGSADVYLLLAGLAVAARHGFETADAVARARERYVDVNVFSDREVANRLARLPSSCFESAACLQEQREIFERHGVFAPALVDGTITALRQFNDRFLRQEIQADPGKLMELVQRFFHRG
jgi:glutamine synthetase